MNDVDACSTLEPSEPLSWQEICRRYPDQWVALFDIDWLDEDEVRATRVAGHGPRRADHLGQARHLHSRYEDIYSFLHRTTLRVDLASFAFSPAFDMKCHP